MFETLFKNLKISTSPNNKLNRLFDLKCFRVSQCDDNRDYDSFMLPRVYGNDRCVSEYEMIEYSPVALKPLERDCEDLDNVVDRFIFVTSVNKTHNV